MTFQVCGLWGPWVHLGDSCGSPDIAVKEKKRKEKKRKEKKRKIKSKGKSKETWIQTS